MSAIGKHIRDMRTRSGDTQAELAALAGLSTSYVSRIEAGLRKPGSEALARLSHALGVTSAELSGTAPADPVVVETELARAQADLESGYPHRALHSMNSLLSRYADSLDSGPRYRILLARAAARYRTGDHGVALAALDEMLSGAVPADVLSSLLQTMSALYLEQGDLARAIDLARAGLETVEGAESPDGDIFTMLGATLASAYRERGDLDSAYAVGRRMLAAAERANSPRARGEAYRTASLNAEASGDKRRARVLASRALGAFTEGQAHLQLARMRLAYSRILLAARPDQVDDVRHLLSEAEPVLKVSASTELVECRLQLARACLVAGDVQGATEAARLAAAGIGGRNEPQLMRARLIMAQVCLQTGNLPDALETLAAVRGSLAILPASRAAARAWRELGDLYATADSAVDAIAAYNRALLMVSMPVQPDQAEPTRTGTCWSVPLPSAGETSVLYSHNTTGGRNAAHHLE
jgi:transcriptional regulator with XRE-family HTH domain